jgi:protein-tyrosine phosphatase
VRVYEIVPGLLQSVTPMEPDDRTFTDQDGRPVKVTAVVDLEGTIDPNIPLEEIGDVYLYWPIEDKPRMVDQDTVRSIARFVVGLVDAGHQVLVHCHSGLNRASLITGRALVARGMDAKDAVELLRERRSPECLNNRVFHDWLLGEEPGT